MCCIQQAYFPWSLPKSISSSLVCLIKKKLFWRFFFFFPSRAKIHLLSDCLAIASFDQQPPWLVLICQTHAIFFSFDFPELSMYSDPGFFQSYLFGNHASRKPSLIPQHFPHKLPRQVHTAYLLQPFLALGECHLSAKARRFLMTELKP